jgi:peptidoglycan/LPS O-acetylase OafA/YrhL
MEKRHFIFLDGLRGIAAFAVALLHASLIFKLGLRPWHAYLAVDFFFCLSGFVVAYAYDGRLINKMTVPSFCKRRLIRLYPMILIGILLGYVATLGNLQLQGRLNLPADTLLLFATLFMLPVGLLFHHQAYPLNNPLWSLFFELFANFVYAVWQRFRLLAALPNKAALAFAAIVLILIAWRFHSVQSLGFSNPVTFLGGFVRIFYPFLMGVVIFRYSLFNHQIRLPSPLLAAALITIMFLPIAIYSTWLYDSVAIVFLFPAIVILGTRSTDFIDLSKAWEISGMLSYPFYVIHQPILRIVYVVCVRTGLAQKMPYLSAFFGLVVAVVVSYACSRLYDEPVRAWLSKLGSRECQKVEC